MRGHLALKYNTEPKQQKAEERNEEKMLFFVFFFLFYFTFLKVKEHTITTTTIKYLV